MIDKRIQKLIQSIQNEETDSLFITSKANVYYYSNYYTDPHERLVAIYISKLHDPVLIVPAMEIEDVKNAGWPYEIIQYADHENVWELFHKYIEDQQAIPKTIGLEYNDLTLERSQMIQRIFPNITITDIQNTLAQQRLIKTNDEYELLKEAAHLADFGVKVGMNAIREGISELELIAEIEYALKKRGIQEMSFATIALRGEKTASPHGTPSTDEIQDGDLILFDLGVVYKGYCSDITRTFAYKYINDDQRLIYDTVLKAEKDAIHTAQIDNEVGQIDRTARNIITEAGYGKYFTHRIGHGLGIDVHEYPSMHQENKLKLQQGMCFTIEPGIYVPNVGGVRIEDMIFMTSEGPEILTASPKELTIIE